MPEPADDELLVRVHAATISRTDCALLAATPFIMRFATGLLRPRNQTLGTDFAGRVEAVGARVEGFQAGNRVWGLNDIARSGPAGACSGPAACAFRRSSGRAARTWGWRS